MEREQELEQARKVTRRFLSQKGQHHKHTRIHKDTHEIKFQEFRALNGICSQCTNLEIIASRARGGQEIVNLQCTSGVNIPNLFLATPLGEEASCDKFTPINESAEV